jgi:NAD(P)-dependent dehydrogenase (short-subunit alcohol dehydrogenase family)
MKSLQQEVVVITGASSGIGRAAALAFAEAGANVVVAARRVEPLAELVDECRRRGAAALAVQTDVTDEGSVRELARRARETFGGIDVWVANAAVSAFGRFEETPLESFRRVIETNFFGYVYGARAVLPHFRTRGRGTLILVGSMLSRLSSPFMSAYVASKHAVRGFAASLRQELAVDGERDIHVAVIMPQSVDTPFFQHSANYTGRAVQVMPPVLRPETVARRIVALARRPRRERFAGNAARALALLQVVAKGITERLLATMVNRMQLSTREHAPASDGNLFTPMALGTEARGGWRPLGRHPSPLREQRESSPEAPAPTPA